ncbi:IMPORTIN ALPHA, IMPORTIN ALPHA ISOFORM 1, importin alpha isoform 1 [Hibiscus trionum]|uniref:IMPORTIN ALPHA, IMPORTIN ALPHA ISOFORM 1, importin alpha isoform 1 n=1 Tax=Hibiscus trionum TaxID=183268 RepID=A0A9W7ISJ0_HIBTR|nr:IMPORTIN ALPHA, IMPORTIN ALPHA ISOFORM 1, importin alpha isoform 1 [Hibiscus trionum]
MKRYAMVWILQAVIEANIIAPLVHLQQNDEFDIKEEAALAIANAASCGTHDQIRFLVSQGCIKPLCDLIWCDPSIVKVSLKGLENILKVGEDEKTMGTTDGVNLYKQMIKDARGRWKIKYLRSHYEEIYNECKSELHPDTIEIYEKAVEVLKTYWLEEDDVR